jgi:hypothetical protein
VKKRRSRYAPKDMDFMPGNVRIRLPTICTLQLSLTKKCAEISVSSRRKSRRYGVLCFCWCFLGNSTSIDVMVGSNLFSVAGRQQLSVLNRGVEHQDGRMPGSEVKSIPGTRNLRRNSGLPVHAATEMSSPYSHAAFRMHWIAAVWATGRLVQAVAFR